MSNADWLILNIDDEPAVRYLKTRALQRAGFSVIEASSGLEGLACVESHKPHLVMCDVKMPDMNGFEVCRQIKAAHPHMLVLQVSASFVSSHDRAAGLDLGADSYLTEPVEPAELVAAVRALLRMKRAEDELRTLNARLESEVAQRTRERDRIWAISRDLMAVLDADLRMMSNNPAWTATLGYDASDLASRPFLDLIDEEDRESMGRTLRNLDRPGYTRVEGKLRTSDGSARWISWSFVRDDACSYALGRDTTEEKERADELEAAQSQIRQSQKMEALGQLTGGIAHDFNNLLTGILGSLDLVGRRIAKEQYDNLSSFLDVAVGSARRAATLTNRLLVFSRMQSLRQESVDSRSLVEGTQDLLRRTIGEHIDLRFDLPAAPWMVQTDRNQFEIALLNLVLNARDAMPAGGSIRIEVANETIKVATRPATLAPGDYVRITVRDHGSGMTQEVMDKAFDPFFTTKPIGQGTGLGLSMVYGFAKQSGGHVTLRSKDGEGTAVDIFLPRYSGENHADAHAGKSRTGAVDGAAVILVTEDDAAVRSIVSSLVGELGYRALVAATGDEAVGILRSGARIDLLITDIGLPDRSGIEVAALGRAARPDLNVLFMTGYAESAAAQEATRAVRTQLIMKPFDLDALAGKVRDSMQS